MKYLTVEELVTHVTQNHEERYNPTAPVFKCDDGYVVSIQAGQWAYSIPRRDSEDSYESYELGFPNRSDELLDEYAENIDDLTETVYGYVPADVVLALINKHMTGSDV